MQLVSNAFVFQLGKRRQLGRASPRLGSLLRLTLTLLQFLRLTMGLPIPGLLSLHLITTLLALQEASSLSLLTLCLQFPPTRVPLPVSSSSFFGALHPTFSRRYSGPWLLPQAPSTSREICANQPRILLVCTHSHTFLDLLAVRLLRNFMKFLLFGLAVSQGRTALRVGGRSRS